MSEIESPVMECSWCGTNYTTFKANCSNCGGPIAPPPGEHAGPSPPAPPRELPSGYMRRQALKSPLLLVGAIFSLVGLPFAIIFGSSGIRVEPGQPQGIAPTFSGFTVFAVYM